MMEQGPRERDGPPVLALSVGRQVCLGTQGDPLGTCGQPQLAEQYSSLPSQSSWGRLRVWVCV